MPAPIPYAQRLEMIERKRAGQSLRQIAEEMGYSYWGVRKIWRQYRGQSEEGLQTRYKRGPGLLRKPQEVYAQAIAWKREHPGWGAGLVRSLLLERWPEEDVPCERTLQQWWRRAGVHRRPQRRVAQNRQRAKKVHEVWQIDGVEVNGMTWVTVTDEYSGAVLAGCVFPL